MNGPPSTQAYFDCVLSALLLSRDSIIVALVSLSGIYVKDYSFRYANRAKNIKNKPKINEDPKDALLREYQEEIVKLRALLAGQMGGDGNIDSMYSLLTRVDSVNGIWNGIDVFGWFVSSALPATVHY